MTTEELIAAMHDYCAEWDGWIERDQPDDMGPAPVIARDLLIAGARRLGEMHLKQETFTEMHRRAQRAESQEARLRRRLRAVAGTARYFAELVT